MMVCYGNAKILNKAYSTITHDFRIFRFQIFTIEPQWGKDAIKYYIKCACV